jgi:hypothetical protein
MGIFSVASGNSMRPGSTQPFKMSTRILLHMADNLPPSSADVTESGSLNIPEPSGPHTTVMGLKGKNVQLFSVCYLHMMGLVV